MARMNVIIKKLRLKKVRLETSKSGIRKYILSPLETPHFAPLKKSLDVPGKRLECPLAINSILPLIAARNLPNKICQFNPSSFCKPNQ